MFFNKCDHINFVFDFRRKALMLNKKETIKSFKNKIITQFCRNKLLHTSWFIQTNNVNLQPVDNPN